MYLWRYQEGRRIAKLFADTNGYVYVNLQLVSHVNNLLTILIGFCCFFGTIKLIKLCRFHPRLCLFLHTLQHAGKELLSFSVLFSLIFMSFVCLFSSLIYFHAVGMFQLVGYNPNALRDDLDEVRCARVERSSSISRSVLLQSVHSVRCFRLHEYVLVHHR